MSDRTQEDEDRERDVQRLHAIMERNFQAGRRAPHPVDRFRLIWPVPDAPEGMRSPYEF
jgi:hypothetical protein